MDYKIKRVLITGAAQGIGYAVAQSLSKEALHIIISDIDQARIDSAVTELRKECGQETLITGNVINVADKENVFQAVAAIEASYGPIDGLVNNAGICYPATPLNEISEEEWIKVFGVNVLGMINCTNAVVEGMKKQNFGKIVNMSSSSGFTGGISVSASYAVSKAGVMALTKNMAKQFGPYGINVNALSPGIIKTEMTENLEYDMSVLALRRFGERAEVADVAAFLLAKESDYLTGNTIDINGGLYMR